MGGVLDILKKEAPACGGDIGVNGIQIAVVGGYQSGKTTMCLELMGRGGEDVIPTGMEAPVFINKQAKERMNEWIAHAGSRSFKILDVGGKERYHNLWTQRFRGVCGMMYVIDCTSELLIQQQKSCLHELVLSHVQAAQIPVLIVFNDKHLSESLYSDESLVDLLSLTEVIPDNRMVETYRVSSSSSSSTTEAFERLLQLTEANLLRLSGVTTDVMPSQRG